MTCIRAIGLPAAAAIVAAGTAAADVTPEQVWEHWKQTSALSSVVVSADSEVREGATLVLRGVGMNLAEGDIRMSVRFGDLRLHDRGDGTVGIEMAPEQRMTGSFSEPGIEQMEFQALLRQDDMTTIASGSIEAMSYDMSGAGLGLVLERMSVDGEDLPLDLGMVFGAFSGVYNGLLRDGALEQDYDFAADTLTFTLAASDPQGDGEMSLEFETRDIAATASGTMVQGMDFADLPAMLRAGFAMVANYTTGPSRFGFDFTEGGEATSARGSSSSGEFNMAMDADRLEYSVATTDFDLTVTGDEIPLPEINVTMSEYALGLLMPLGTTEEPADFSFLARLVDLSVTDAIWGMFDPMGGLPRDPATLVIDARGKAKMLADILDPMAMAMEDEPAELHALDLDELRLSAVGAELTGSGAFTFDNSDLETFGGLPRPEGSLDLTLVGGNGLLDRLVEMGFVPQDQAMGARMMMGLFGRPGEGEDTIHSTIEVTPDGAVLANGQRIQ